MQKLAGGARKLGLSLDSEQLEKFELYFKELIDWNQKINLTAITDYEEVQLKHFLDSLTVVLGMGEKVGRIKVIDIGAGAGLPGIPLKILFPDIRLTLMEATNKKTKFLEDLVGKLKLDGVEVVAGRAEEMAHDPNYREHFDLVLARAVAALPALVELTLPFCAVGGRFVAQKKGDIGLEVKQSQKVISLMGGIVKEVKAIDLPELADDRCLIIVDKIKPTPVEYPRRPGIPAKKPILG